MVVDRFWSRELKKTKNYYNLSLKYFDWKVFIILFFVVLIFLIAHILTGALLEKIPVIINISHDRSIPEWFCYGMLGTASFMLLRAFLSVRSPLLISFSVILLFMLVDDSLEVHEVGGAMIATSLGYVSLFGLDPKDTGELLAYGLMGLIIMPFSIYGVIRTPLSQWREYYALAIFVGMLGLFAVGIDLIHEPVCRIVALGGYCFQIVDLLEDGGEMFWEAVIVAHVSRAFAVSKLQKASVQR